MQSALQIAFAGISRSADFRKPVVFCSQYAELLFYLRTHLLSVSFASEKRQPEFDAVFVYAFFLYFICVL